MIDKLVGKKVAKKLVKKVTKKEKPKGSKSKATQKGVRFGTNKTMVMAKDRPFGKDLDYQTGARGEAEVKGRPGEEQQWQKLLEQVRLISVMMQ
tara:strand:+ start:7 stop:288 length:282 start_codon:yes stop_codon:yes gene_type:complete